MVSVTRQELGNKPPQRECHAVTKSTSSSSSSFNGLSSGTTRVGRYQKKHQFFWIFMEQGKIMEAEAPTVRVGATPTGLMAPPPTQPPKVFVQAGCRSCRPTISVKALKAQLNHQ